MNDPEVVDRHLKARDGMAQDDAWRMASAYRALQRKPGMFINWRQFFKFFAVNLFLAVVLVAAFVGVTYLICCLPTQEW